MERLQRSELQRAHGAAAYLIAGGAVAALTGLLGCFLGGLTGAAWMALGELAATAPVFALELRRR